MFKHFKKTSFFQDSSKASSRKSSIKKYFIIGTLFILFGILTFGLKLYIDFLDMNKVIHEGVNTEPSKLREEEIDISQLQPFSILLVGVDEDPDTKGPGRSDTMMVMTINPHTNTTYMYSVPRDLRFIIPGYEKKGYQKFNNTYSLGGTQLVRESIEDYLDIPIDYTVEINFNGFIDLVDALNGITVENDLEFSLGGYDFPIGPIEMDGQKALIYSRMRIQDKKNGDFGRQERQKLVIKEMLEKMNSFTNVTKLSKIFKAVEENVKTSLFFEDMLDIKKKYSGALNQMNSLQTKYETGYFNRQDYVLVFHEERLRVIHTLREHLELPIKDSSDYPNHDAEMVVGRTTAN